MWLVIKAIPAKIWGWVMLTLALGGFIYTIYREGQKSEDVKDMKESLKSARRAKEIEYEVDGISDDDIVKRLRDNGWFR